MGRKNISYFIFFLGIVLFFISSSFIVSAGYCANPAETSYYCSGKTVSQSDCCPSAEAYYGEEGAPKSSSECKSTYYSSADKTVGGLCTTLGCCYIDTEKTCDSSSLQGECEYNYGIFDTDGCEGSTVKDYCAEGCCIYYDGTAYTSVISSKGFCDASVAGAFDEGVTDSSECSELVAEYTAAGIECDDDVDNDGDGLTDYPLDTGCSSAADSSEQTTESACDDGKDNDGDGYIDTTDTGCCNEPETTNEELCELSACGTGEITTACNCYETTQATGTYCEAGNYCVDGICQTAAAECEAGERLYCGTDEETNCHMYQMCQEAGTWGDCEVSASCGREPEVCDDGADQDEDGLVDCDDTDCYETKCGTSSDTSACRDKGFTEDGKTYLCCSTTNVNDCDNDGIDETCGSCECSTTPIEPEIEEVEFTLGKAQLTVIWELACRISFHLRRCTGNDCITDITGLKNEEIESAFPEIIGANIEDAWEYTDTTISPNQRYCYAVQALYPDGSSTYSQPYCIDDSGDYLCQIMSTSEFCIDNYLSLNNELVNRVGCTDENKLSYIENCHSEYSSDYICVGPYSDGTTSCEYQSNCARCGDPLGLYSILELSILENEDDKYYGELCSSIPMCYFDYTLTTIDIYQECADVNSCYDYASKSACEEQTNENNYNNKCLMRDCEWIDLSEEGGIPTGICKEKSADYASCDACNDAVHNNVFGACTKERCKEYGVDDADCYLSGLTNLCTDIADFTCTAYDDATSCRGDYNVEIDSNTNAVSVASADILGLGLCYWNGEECYKDANGDGLADDGQADMTPPTTRAISPKKMSVLNITLLATDFNEDGSTGDGVKATYYCLTEDGSFCYPDEKVSLSTTGIGVIELGNDSGTYSLYYYSEDYAENLEVVQEYSFDVDKKGPLITIDYYVGADTTEPYDASSLTFEISLDEEGYCSDYFETGESKIENEFNDYFVVKYTGLSDGGYLYNVTCTDSLGNTGEAFVLAYVDADSAIFDSSPYYYSDSGSVTLSVKTLDDADCGFSEGVEENSFEAMDEGFEKEKGDGYYIHSREWSLDKEGIYFFDVKCEIEGRISDDEIEFVYDETPPTTEVTDGFGNQLDLASFYSGEELSIYLTCTDEPRFGFGCDKTYYCIDTATCTPDTLYEYYNDIPYPDTSKAYLCYYSKEKSFAGMGGLEEETKCTEIKIDSYVPELTITSPLDYEAVYVPYVIVEGYVEDPDATEGTAINTVTITVKDTKGNETSYENIDADDGFSYTVPINLENNLSTYNYITVTGYDRSGAATESETLHVRYTTELGEDALWIVEPDNGVSDEPEFDFTIGTLLEAEKCGYSKNNAALNKSKVLKETASDGENLYLYTAEYSIETTKDGIPEYVYVKCLLENGVEYAETLILEYDSTKPVIENIEIVNSDGKSPPSIVEEPLEPEIQVTTDDRTKCKYSLSSGAGFNTGMYKFDDYENRSYNTTNSVIVEGLEDMNRYTIYIACQNGAYMTSDKESLTFTINTSAASGMYLISPTATSSRTFTITIGTTKSATDCDYGNSIEGISTSMTAISEKRFKTGNITVTGDGNYTYYFGCWFVDGYFTDYFGFPVDTTPPVIDYIEDGNISFSNTTLSATWSASDSLTKIIGYMYSIGTRQGYNNTYNWTNTTEKEGIVEGLNLTNQSTYYWNVKAVNEVGLWSTSKSSDGIFIDVAGSGTSRRLNTSEVGEIDYHQCANGILNEDETDIDCGGGCDACEAGKACNLDTDCSSLNCYNSVCQEATCEDNIQNQGESDIDCGGNYCEPCSEGKACVYHRDCASKYCSLKSCTAPSCNDGVENGDETGIDCGGSCVTNCTTTPQDSPPKPPVTKKGLPWWFWTLLVMLIAGGAITGYYGYIYYMKKKGKLPANFQLFGGIGKRLLPIGKFPQKLPQKMQMPSFPRTVLQKAQQQKQQLREKFFQVFEEKPKQPERLPEKMVTKPREKEIERKTEKETKKKIQIKEQPKKGTSKAFTELEKLIKEKKK